MASYYIKLPFEDDGGGGSYTFDDTNSISLTDTSGVVTADLELSASSADYDKYKIINSIETDGLLSQINYADQYTAGILKVGQQDLSGNKYFARSYVDLNSFNANLTAFAFVNNTVSTPDAFNIAFYPGLIINDSVDHDEPNVAGNFNTSVNGSANMNNIVAGVSFSVEHNGTGDVELAFGMNGSVNTTASSPGNIVAAIGGNFAVEHEGSGEISQAVALRVGSAVVGDGNILESICIGAAIENDSTGGIVQKGTILFAETMACEEKFGVIIDIPESQNILHQLTLKAALDIVPSDLVDGATIPVDAALSNIFTVELTGNRTLENPTNAKDGQTLMFRIRQGGTGTNTLALDTKYRFGTTLPTIVLSTAVGSLDYLTVIYNEADDSFDVVDFKGGF